MVMRIGYSWQFIRLKVPDLQFHEWAPSLRSCGVCAIAAVTLRESSVIQCMESIALAHGVLPAACTQCSQVETVKVWHDFSNPIDNSNA